MDLRASEHPEPSHIHVPRPSRVVPVGDETALAEAIAAEAADPVPGKQRAAAMLAHVRADYTLETNTARLIDLYKALASGERPQLQSSADRRH